PDVQKYFELARKLTKACEAGIGFLGCDRGKQSIPLDLEKIGHLGREHVMSAPVPGLRYQSCRGLQVGLRRETRSHLHQPGSKHRIGMGTHASLSRATF